MRHIIYCLTLLFLGCQNNGSESSNMTVETKQNIEESTKAEVPNGTVNFLLDTIPYNFSNLKADKTSALFESNKISFHFEDNDVPVNVDLTIRDMSILDSGSKTYNLPQDNEDKIIVDLSFMDYTRIGKMSVKQIKFKEGTIEISQIDKNTISLNFEGKAGPVVNDGTFSTKGSINFSFPK